MELLRGILFNTRKFSLFLFFYLSLAIGIYVFIFAHKVSYDGWVFDGIFWPVAGFIAISVIAMTLINDTRKLVLVGGIFLGSLNILPALKYPLFYGTFDSPGHYRFAEQIAAIGRVPINEFYSTTYGANPGIHIFSASFSIVSGIPVNDVLEFLIPILYGLIPFAIYFVGRKFLDSDTLKFTIIASILPIIPAYEIWGTALIFIPYLFFLSVFIVITVNSNIQNMLSYLLLAILIFTIVISHAVTSLLVSLFLPCLFLALIVYRQLTKRQLSLNFRSIGFISSLFILILVFWWSIAGLVNVNTLIDALRGLLDPTIPVVPKTFFTLPIIPQLQVLFLLNAANIVTAVLTAVGIVIFLRTLKKTHNINSALRLYMVVITLILIIVFFIFAQLAINFGVFSYQRLLIYAFPLCFFPMGLALSRLNLTLKHKFPRARLALVTSLVLVLVSLCLVQMYPPQSLVPKANVLSNTLPSDEYILDLSLVNTAYQAYMISFASKYYSNGSVVADVATRSQAYYFSNASFFSHIEYASPLDPANANMTWQLYLLHTSEAGPFGEKPEYRTDKIITETKNNMVDVIYDNGASFVLSKIVD